MKLPSSGAAIGDLSSMRDPHKFGKVMWARTDSGNMAPLDLHGRIPVSDEDGLNDVFEQLRMFRKVRPALKSVVDRNWFRMDLIKPYLIETMKIRAEAREMMSMNEWDEFWSVIK